MERRAIRDIRSVVVGTGSTLLLPERTARVLTFVGAPPPPTIPALPSSNFVGSTSIAGAGNLLNVVIPAGGTVRLTGWEWASVSTTAIVALKLVHLGTPYTLDVAPANVWRTLNMAVSNPDSIQVVVTTAGLGGETATAVVGVESYTAGPRISLGFGVPAVLDSGLTIYAGQLPLILPGPVLDVDIFAIADAASRLVNVVDIFYP